MSLIGAVGDKQNLGTHLGYPAGEFGKLYIVADIDGHLAAVRVKDFGLGARPERPTSAAHWV